MRNFALGMLFNSLILVSCGSDTRDRENYGNLQEGPGGVKIMSSQEHRGGYGREDCLICHNISLNVHRGPNIFIDPEELNRLYRTNGQQAYCMNEACHGSNGTR